MRWRLSSWVIVPPRPSSKEGSAPFGRAWIRLFSSTERTMAWAGGRDIDRRASRSFSAKAPFMRQFEAGGLPTDAGGIEMIEQKHAGQNRRLSCFCQPWRARTKCNPDPPS